MEKVNFNYKAQKIVFPTADCDNSPDLGENSGIVSHDWVGDVSENTVITYWCSSGNAFNSKWTQSLTNTCKKHGTDTFTSWQYKSSSPVPNCIRKYIYIFYEL